MEARRRGEREWEQRDEREKEGEAGGGREAVVSFLEEGQMEREWAGEEAGDVLAWHLPAGREWAGLVS